MRREFIEGTRDVYAMDWPTELCDAFQRLKGGSRKCLARCLQSSTLVPSQILLSSFSLKNVWTRNSRCRALRTTGRCPWWCSVLLRCWVMVQRMESLQHPHRPDQYSAPLVVLVCISFFLRLKEKKASFLYSIRS
jgi:hypothetical protein